MYLFDNEPTMAEIYKDGIMIKKVSLTDEVTEIPVMDGDKENIVVIKNKKVSMKFANCPDKLCVKQGEIGNVNTPIVCLPNRVVVKLTGTKTEVDAVVR